jgi:hypothetical protein
LDWTQDLPHALSVFWYPFLHLPPLCFCENEIK